MQLFCDFIFYKEIMSIFFIIVDCFRNCIFDTITLNSFYSKLVFHIAAGRKRKMYVRYYQQV